MAEAPPPAYPGIPGSPVRLYFMKAHPDAVPPTRMTANSVSYDLCSCEDVVVPPGGRSVVSTGLILVMPPGCYGRIAPRAGLAVKFFIDVGAGVIHPDYRGVVSVVLFNFSSHAFNVRKGDRIAHFILERVETPDVEEIKHDGTGGGGNAGAGFDGGESSGSSSC